MNIATVRFTLYCIGLVPIASLLNLGVCCYSLCANLDVATTKLNYDGCGPSCLINVVLAYMNFDWL